MIYLFDRAKKLQKIIPRKHIINANPTVVRNGIYQLAVEVPLFYEDKKGTQYNYQKSVGKAEFAGHYDDKNRFQLYKIYSRNITANNQGEFLLFDGVHIFFDEAKAMGNIHDRRFRDSEAKAPADAVFNSIGWTVIDYDVTDRHDINFYRASVTDAWNDLISTYGVEFDYELQFDGRKIISKNIIMKKQIGKWTGQRFAYGTNVMTLTQEQDESEVYTAAVGRGRGEEAGDGFGPRLEFGDIAWSKDGISKPVGQNYIELPSATAEYGFIEDGVVKPRIAPEVIFEDIEDKIKLADSTYYWLLENCVPKATWKTDVARIGNLNLGDTVGVLYKAAGIIKRARVEKIEYNLLDPELSKLTLGDFHHFENRQMKRINAQIKRLGRDNRSLITQVKDAFDQQFNAWVTAFKNEFEQEKIDIFAEIEADRQNMQNLLDNKSAEWTENFNQSVAESKEYAEQQAQEKADEVRTDLETVTSGHQTMLQELENSVINIDDFLGDSRSVTLDERFQDITMNFEERIRNIDSTHFNMIRGTSFDNPDLMSNQSSVEIITNETDNFARLGLGTSNVPFILLNEYFHVEQGQKYHLVFTYRTDDVPEIDYAHLRPPSGYGGDLVIEEQVSNADLQTVMSGQWSKKVYTFVSDRSMPVRLLLGTNFGAGNTQRGILDIKKPYLTTTNNREWLPHPDDDTQNVSEIVRRVTLLEDGRNELITKSEYDFETGQLDQYIKSVEETVEGNKTVLQRVEDWQATNGASIEETIYGFDQKVWLNDVANIGANLIPLVSGVWERGNISITTGQPGVSTTSIRTKEYIDVSPGTEYTLSDNSTYLSEIARVDVHQYSVNNGWIASRYIERGGKVTFTTWSNTVKVRVAITAISGFTLLPEEIERTSEVKLKFEMGASATPMLNAISRIEQLANSVAIQVQELDGEYLSQSDLQITPNYWQLGSMRIGADNVSSVLRGSPDALDAVVSNFNLTGNLNAKGQITTLAVDAIEGNFARLFANQLTANVITSDHIQVGTALVDKMFATSARIDELITKTHFVNNVKAMSIEAVEGQFSTLFTRYLSANYIDADYIVGKNAWFETQYVKSSNISNLTSQTAFIRDVQAIEITANQMNIQTLHSKLRSVEGGLTIYGPDGRVLINNSVLRASFDVQLRPSYGSNDVDFNGLNYQTKSPDWQTFEYFYTEYKGSKLLVSWAYSLAGGSPSGVELAEFRVRGFGGNNPIATRDSNRWVEKGTTGYNNQIIELGVPDYSTIQAYLEFRRSPSEQHTENIINVRVLRVSMID